jgi:hypothetical protein
MWENKLDRLFTLRITKGSLSGLEFGQLGEADRLPFAVLRAKSLSCARPRFALPVAELRSFATWETSWEMACSRPEACRFRQAQVP